jgi:hypothetical protein
MKTGKMGLFLDLEGYFRGLSKAFFPSYRKMGTWVLKQLRNFVELLYSSKRKRGQATF